MLVAVITTTFPSLTLMRADEKLKKIMKWLRFIIILMIHGSDAECSALSPTNTILMLGLLFRVRALEIPKLRA